MYNFCCWKLKSIDTIFGILVWLVRFLCLFNLESKEKKFILKNEFRYYVIWYRPTLNVIWCQSEATRHGQNVYLYLLWPRPILCTQLSDVYVLTICVSLSDVLLILPLSTHLFLFINVCVFHFNIIWCNTVICTICLALVDFYHIHIYLPFNNFLIYVPMLSCFIQLLSVPTNPKQIATLYFSHQCIAPVSQNSCVSLWVFLSAWW